VLFIISCWEQRTVVCTVVTCSLLVGYQRFGTRCLHVARYGSSCEVFFIFNSPGICRRILAYYPSIEYHGGLPSSRVFTHGQTDTAMVIDAFICSFSSNVPK
jgi:hypothetical protein